MREAYGMKWEPWKVVYQGGHHNVWCNNIFHTNRYGGHCHADQPMLRITSMSDIIAYPCNCSKFAQEE